MPSLPSFVGFVYIISETLLYEFATPGMYVWSLILSTILWCFFFVLGKIKPRWIAEYPLWCHYTQSSYLNRDALLSLEECYALRAWDWKIDLLIQPLSALVSYLSLVVEMENFKTLSTTIRPRTELVWQGLIAVLIAMLISLAFKRKKIHPLYEKNRIPIGLICLEFVVIGIVILIQALVYRQFITPTLFINIVKLLIMEQLQGRDISIPLLAMSTCLYRFLFTADWKWNEHSFGVSILVVIVIYSLIYLCQKTTIYFPSVLAVGGKILLQDKFFPNLMMGLLTIFVSWFYWYFEFELSKPDETTPLLL